MRPDHVPPEPRLVAPTPWEWIDDPQHGRIVRVWSRTYDQWSRQLPWTGVVHERLDAGDGFADIVAAVKKAGNSRDGDDAVRSRVGTYLYSLWIDGVVAMDFPPAPEWFTDTLETRGELGRGGVGVAWRCFDHARGQDVVVKHAWDFFHPLRKMDRLIRQEAEIFRTLDHPGVLRLYDTFERDGLLHMVRELVDGEELHLVPKERSLDLKAAARDLVGILEHVHARGHLLLDVRPANFFLRAHDRRVVLVDVGNCVSYAGGTIKLKKPMGSPAFSAPEVRKRKEASAASDVYGLGRLLFTLATGRPPIATWTEREMAEPLGDHPLAELILELSDEDAEERPSLAEIRERLK